jgi:hypothetical protein
MRQRHMAIAVTTLAGLAGSASAQTPYFTENFDSYAAGAALAPSNGWQTWVDYTTGTTGLNAYIDSSQRSTSPNSLRLQAQSDVVRRFTGVTSGQWSLKMKVYVPSAFRDRVNISVLNRYQPSSTAGSDGSYQWSAQVQIDAVPGANTSNKVIDTLDPLNTGAVTLVTNAWVEVRFDVNLDADTFSQYYNGQLLGAANRSWSHSSALDGNGPSSAQRAIEAIDLFGSAPLARTTYAIYVDDITLTRTGGTANTCYANCDGSSTVPVLSVADYLCFLNRFRSGDSWANCDGSTSTPILTAGDFNCFQKKFVAGCP